MAGTPEESDCTSIKQRTKHFAQLAQTSTTVGKVAVAPQPTDLFPFVGNPRQPMPIALAYTLTDYLELVHWTGRQIRDDKRRSIDNEQRPILSRLDISPQHWVYLCTQFESRFKGLVARVETVKQACASFGLKTVRNRKESTLLFG